MEVRRIVFIGIVFGLSLVACVQHGTEVTNPPDESNVFISKEFGLSLTLPEGWTYTEYVDGVEPGLDVYSDPVGTADTIALFTKGETNFVALYNTLVDDETLEAYIRARHPDEGVEVICEDDMCAAGISLSDAGAEDNRAVIIMYASIAHEVAALRMEIVANSQEEADTILSEFENIVESLLF